MVLQNNFIAVMQSMTVINEKSDCHQKCHHWANNDSGRIFQGMETEFALTLFKSSSTRKVPAPDHRYYFH